MRKKEELKIELPSEEREIEEEVLSMEEALAKISMLLTKEEKIRMLTELDDQEIRLVSSLLGIADRYNLQFVKSFVNNFMLLRVSLRRKGRGEIVNLAQQIPELTEKIKGKLGKFGIVLK